ncbi:MULTISPECIES: ABC transporter substrate-binding protein [Acinetobacter]|uniref:ABC transporter substrate-binding protein n=1 Tax=Acinetobacter TaxID=469 RepID=UPI0009D6EE95|nr:MULTISPECIES: ABC transporter substrate-binding protein [Acinetobacter]MBJ8463368.1 ABC transporter substrate-binding protein [Acinetobacter nosocomialis]MBP1485886.1 ABC transporter substrate-binding protein [Acinetobacter nosocomialis]MBP1498013.1 ABC transporter substrate-binding protein [Acinetobacter nosocomialis]MBR7689032.1 ABC transporter substrate-binding protein [Acinetobacter nosocomialis]MBR7727456.1 ABC transporter substrate-binding protein [Acinetobacter nosocomialis]
MDMNLKLKFFKLAILSLAITSIPCAYAITPAQPNKILHVAYEAPDDGFDMVKTTNFYSASIAEAIFEPLLKYDYLARPLQLVPYTAESMPKVEQDGKVYIFKIKPGIYFTDDPAFKGKRRELVAEDYIYSIKRILDPKNRAPSVSFLDGKLLGADAVVAQAKKTGKFDYAVPIAGLKATDRYTLQFTLTRQDYNFPYILAYIAFGAVAKEIVDYYGDRIGMHPVGTGPYMLSKYVPRSKVELVANPDYRGFVWNFKSTGTPWDNQLVKEMSGKKMPQIGKVVVSIIEEQQSRWLAFQSGQLDFDKLTADAVPQALDGNQLKASFQKKGIKHFPYKEPEMTYTMMNMRDPVIGGFSPEKIALRRAITLAYDQKESIKQAYKGQAVRAEMFIPEGVNGYNPKYKSSVGYNPRLANKLLDYYGYKKGADGYRTLPNGKPLVLKINNENSSAAVILSELWKKNLDAIGIRADFKVSNFADNLKAATQCKYMIWSGAWIADYPEGDNFAQLLYGPNAGQGNHACYQSKTYDALYTQAIHLPPQQRLPYYEKLNRQIEADNPWIIHVTRIRNWLIRPQVQGFKPHPMINTSWQYLDITPVKK